MARRQSQASRVYKSDKFSDILAEQSSYDSQNRYRYHTKDMQIRQVIPSKLYQNQSKTSNFEQTPVINAQNKSSHHLYQARQIFLGQH